MKLQFLVKLFAVGFFYLAGYASAFAQTLSLSADWNLVGVRTQAVQFDDITNHSGVVGLRGGFNQAFESGDVLAEQRGYWIRSNTEQSITLSGTEVSFDYCSLQAGWNLVPGSGSDSTPVSFISSIQENRPALSVDRIFTWDGTSWKSYETRAESGDLTALSQDHAYYLYLTASGIADQSDCSGVRVSAEGLFSVEADISVTEAGNYNLLASELGSEVTSITITDEQGQLLDTLNAGSGWEGGVPYTEESNGDHHYSVVAYDINGSVLDQLKLSVSVAIGVEAASQTGAAARLYVYGQVSGSTAMRSLQEVSVLAVADDGSDSEVLTTIGSSSEGVELSTTGVGSRVRLKSVGYITTDVVLEAENYVVLSKESSEEVVLPASMNSTATAGRPLFKRRALGRELEASPAARAPSTARNDFTAGLMFAAGRTNPNRSIRLTITPMEGVDAVPDLDSLQQVVQSYDQTAGMTGEWSMRVVGGAHLKVTDMSSGEELTLAERSSASIGAFGGITPYISSAIGGDMGEYKALYSSKNMNQGTLPGGGTLAMRVYAYTDQGWVLIDDAIRGIDPSKETDFEPAAGRNDGIYGYSAIEELTVSHVFPRSSDTFVLRTENENSLMSQEDSSRGGLFDYVVVASETQATTRDINIQVVDDATGAGVANARVSIVGGDNGITDAEGRIVFNGVVMPITSSLLTIEAVRNDYVQSVMVVSVEELILNSGVEYVVRANRAGFASINGVVRDGDGEPVEDAVVTLKAPTVLSSLTVNDEKSGIQTFQDSSVTYNWQIRKHESVRETVARGLSRVLESESEFQTIKRLTGRNGGAQLSYNDVLQKLVTLEEGESEDAPYHVMGHFDLQLAADHDIDQDGVVDYQEHSPDGSSLEVAINPGLLSERPEQGILLEERLGTTLSEAIMSTDNVTPINALWGSVDLEFFILFFDLLNYTQYVPEIEWGIDLRWRSGSGEVQQLVRTEDGEYQWSDAAAGFIDSNISQPIIGNGQFLGWKQVLDALSSEELFRAMVRTSPSGRPYIDGDGSDAAGLEVQLKALVYNDGDQGGTVDDTISVSFNVTASYETNPLSIVRVVDANVVAGTQQPEFSVMSDQLGQYRFVDVPAELGVVEGIDDYSPLRLSASKVGYRTMLLQSVPQFTEDDGSTAEREDRVEGVNLELQPEIMRTVEVTVRSAGEAVVGAEIEFSGAERIVTGADGRGVVAVPVGSYELLVWPDEESGYQNHSQMVQVLPSIDGSNLSLSINLISSAGEANWTSPFIPFIDFSVSEITSQGTVLIEGVVEEFVIDPATGDWEVVPYGMAEGVGRIRDAVTLFLNGNRIRLNLNDNSVFRQSVLLDPGYNILKIQAVNEVGIEETEEVGIESGIDVASLAGTVLLPSGEAATAARVVAMDGRGVVQEFITDSSGQFRATDLSASRMVYLQTVVEIEGVTYSNITAESVHLSGGAEIADLTIVLQEVSGHQLNEPLLALDSLDVDQLGRLEFSGRIANFDGSYGNEQRSIYLVVDGMVTALPVSASATEGVWSFSGNAYVGTGSSLFLRAININGQQTATPHVFVELEEDQTGSLDIGITLNGLEVGQEFELWLYDQRGNVVDIVWDVAQSETEMITIEELAVGEYFYDFYPIGALPASGEFTLQGADSAVAIDVVDSEFNINDFDIESLQVVQLGTSNIVSVGGMVRYYLPWYLGQGDVSPELIMDIVQVGGERSDVAFSPSSAQFDALSHSYLLPFDTSFELDNGENQFVATIYAIGGELSQSISYEFTAGDQSENYAEGMGIALQWESGSDLDLHSYFFPNWDAFSGTQLANTNLGDTSTVTQSMTLLGQSDGVTAGLNGDATKPSGYGVRAYVDTLKATEGIAGTVMLYGRMFHDRDVAVPVHAAYAGSRVVVELTQLSDGSVAIIDIPQIDQSGFNNAAGIHDDRGEAGAFIFSRSGESGLPTIGLNDITSDLFYTEYDQSLYSLRLFSDQQVADSADVGYVTMMAESEMGVVFADLPGSLAGSKVVMELTRQRDGAIAYVVVERLDHVGGMNGVGYTDDWGSAGRFDFVNDNQLRGGFNLQHQHIYHGKMTYQINDETQRPRAYVDISSLPHVLSGPLQFNFVQNQISTSSMFHIDEAEVELPQGYELNLFVDQQVDSSTTSMERIEIPLSIPGEPDQIVILPATYQGQRIVFELIKTAYRIQSLDYTGDPSTASVGEATIEHHRWATDRGRVADGTYLVIVHDNGDGVGATVTVNGPGINGITAGEYAFNGQAHEPQPALFIQVENNQIVRVEPVAEGLGFPLEVQNVTNDPYTVVEGETYSSNETDTGSSDFVEWNEQEWYMTSDGYPLFMRVPAGYAMKLYVDSLLPQTMGMEPIFIDARLSDPYDTYVQIPGEYASQKLVLEMVRDHDQQKKYIVIDQLDQAGGSNAVGYQDDYLEVATFAIMDVAPIDGMVELRSTVVESVLLTIDDNEVLNGDVERSGVASYRFTASSTGDYQIYTSGSFDTVGKIIDSGGGVLSENDDGGEGANFFIQHSLVSGASYLLEVRGYGGSEGSFVLTLQPPTQTVQLDAGVAHIDDLSASGGVMEPISASIDDAYERDVYQFTASRSGTFEIFSSGSSDTFAELFHGAVDAENSTGVHAIASNDDGGESRNFLIMAELELGQTYSIHVKGYADTTGEYVLNLIVPDEVSTAGIEVIESAGLYQRSFTGSEMHNFEFTASNAGVYNFYSLGELDTYAEVYAEDGALLNQPGLDDQSGDGSNFYSSLYLDQGQTIYLLLNEFVGASGDYQLVVEFREIIDVSNLQNGQLESDSFTIDGSIDVGNEEHHYYFVAAQSGPYEIWTSGMLDTVGTVTIGARSESYSDDDGGEGSNFMLNVYLQQGDEVQISVGSYSNGVGDYLLETQPVGGAVVLEDGDTTTGEVADLPEVLEGEESYHQVVTAGQPVNLGFAPLYTSRYQITTISSMDTKGAIRNVLGEDLNDPNADAYRGSGSNFLTEIDLVQGERYTIAVNGNYGETGSFWLVITALEGAVVVEDDHGDTTDSATLIDVASTELRTDGVLEHGDDRDLFVFNIMSDGLLSVVTEGSLDTVGVLYSADMVELHYNDDFGGSLNFGFEQPVTAGTYYVAVEPLFEGQIGDYQLVSRFDGDSDDHGDTADSATVIEVIETELRTSGVLENGDDIDLFTFNITSDGVLSVSTESVLDTVGILYDADMVELHYNDYDYSRGSSDFAFEQPVTAGTYYVAVQPFTEFETGDYQLVSRFDGDSGDHGDTVDSATVIEVTETESRTNGVLGNADDIDLFTFNITSDGVLSVSTESVLDTVGILYDADMVELHYNDYDYSRGSSDFAFEQPVTAGTYYVAVQPFTEFETGDYQLVSRFDGAQNHGDSDDHGDSILGATAIDLNSETVGEIDIEGDEDIFMISVRESGELRIGTSGGVDTKGYLLDVYGNEIAFNDDSLLDSNFAITEQLFPGDYFIRVQHYSTGTGPYTLHSSFTVEGQHTDR